MRVVLDASAAIEIALEKGKADTFRELLGKADLILAPDTYPSEISSAFWKYHSFAELPDDACQKGIAYCIDLIGDFIDTKSLCREAFSEACKEGHPVYDMFYLVVARRHDAVLVTRDKKLAKLAKRMRVSVAE